MVDLGTAQKSRVAGDLDRFWRDLEAGRLTGHSYVALLGLRTFDTPGLLKCIRKGVSIHAWERFLSNTQLPADVAAELVGIPSRTLSRRKELGRLQPAESERLVRAARIFAGALVLFEGDAEQARGWLARSHLALGGATPLDYASTEVGAREVEALIGRLEHGIPS